MPMKNPPHPGEIIRDLYIEPLNLTVTEAASHLGVARKTFSKLLNGHAGISADMAIRLSKAFGGNAESWLLLQVHYDLAQALAQNPHPEIKAFARAHLPTQSEESAVNA
jgi:addiction module HigA family antidote